MDRYKLCVCADNADTAPACVIPFVANNWVDFWQPPPHPVCNQIYNISNKYWVACIN